MRTAKQRAASAANAQKSTGPRTPEGKRMSRFNALKHGIFAVHQIMFDEKPEDLAELSAEYREQFAPAAPEECALVDALVHTEWRLRRMRRIEARLWIDASGLYLIRNIDYTITATSGGAFGADSAIFERLQRVVNSCERAYHRAAHELERLQAVRASQPPQPEQSISTSAFSASFRQNPIAYSEAARQTTPQPVESPPNPAGRSG